MWPLARWNAIIKYPNVLYNVYFPHKVKISGQHFKRVIKWIFFRESNDYEPDTETVHSIKRVYLPEDSGNPYIVENKTDLAIIETMDDINSCTESNRDCWQITPVKLADPVKHQTIPKLTTVRTLGSHLIWFYASSIFRLRLGSNWRIFVCEGTVRVPGTIGRNGEQLCPPLSAHRNKCGWEWCWPVCRRFWGTTAIEGWKQWMGVAWNLARRWLQLWR